MSADNGYVLRNNSKGEFVLQMYFMSNDEYPDVEDPDARKFNSIEEALLEFQRGYNTKYWSEYGLSIKVQTLDPTPNEGDQDARDSAVRPPSVPRAGSGGDAGEHG